MSDVGISTEQHETLCIVYNDVILAMVICLGLFSFMPGTYKYAKLKREQISASKCLFHLGIALFLIINLTLVLQLGICVTLCHHAALSQFFQIIQLPVYGLHTSLLIAFLLYRCYLVFRGSIFALSRCTIIFWCTLYSTSTLCGAIAFITAFNQQWAAIMITAILFGAFLNTCSMVFINVMFIFKVVQVYRKVDTDQALINVVTKTSLLAFISTSSYLLFVAMIVANSTQSIHAWFVYTLAVCGDCCTNFWCTLLTYKSFEAWYKKLCCDAKCKQMWYCMLGRHDDVAMMTIDQKSSSSMANVSSADSSVASL